VLKAAGILLLIALILVGALMPLKYGARMNLPKPRPSREQSGRSRDDASD
jgi:hypothetical protein